MFITGMVIGFILGYLYATRWYPRLKKKEDKATEKQLAYIQRLAVETGQVVVYDPNITKAQASAMIDSLLVDRDGEAQNDR